MSRFFKLSKIMQTRLSIIFKIFQNRFFKGLGQPGTIAPSRTNCVENDSLTWSVVRKRLSYGLSFLFFGFLIGNLFGTFLPLIRIIIPWDGLIVLILLFFMELISYSRYTISNREFLGIWKSPMIRQYDTSLANEDESSIFLHPFFDDKGMSLGVINEQGTAAKGKSQQRFQNFFLNRWNRCNYFKLGFLLGFFIDAYKVGS